MKRKERLENSDINHTKNYDPLPKNMFKLLTFQSPADLKVSNMNKIFLYLVHVTSDTHLHSVTTPWHGSSNIVQHKLTLGYKPTVLFMFPAVALLLKVNNW